MFVKEYLIKLSDTDAGGVLFFANQFRIIHDVYEEFMEKSGFSFYDILNKSHLAIPVVQATASYKKPIFLGDQLIIQLELNTIKKHSFILDYFLFQKKFLSKILVGESQTVHVLVDREENETRLIPQNLKKVLHCLR